MAEMVISLFTTMIGGGGAAAAGAATTSSALTLLQGVGTAFAAVTSIGGGIAAYNEGKAQQAQHEFEAREEFVQAKETSSALKLELARTIGNQAVTFAAGGVDLSSVSAQQAKAMAVKDAERELSLAGNEALSRSLARRRAGANARRRGMAGLMQGITGAVEAGVNYGMDVIGRGGPSAMPA